LLFALEELNFKEDTMMNERARTTQWGKRLIIFASLILCLGMGPTPAIAGVDTTGNNFTMTDIIGGLPVDGTNDIHFTWDGTLKTSVSVTGQVPNVTLSSACIFSGSGVSSFTTQ
jgi:hypothetical protein